MNEAFIITILIMLGLISASLFSIHITLRNIEILLEKMRVDGIYELKSNRNV